jgi:hypothetical protein
MPGPASRLPVVRVPLALCAVALLSVSCGGSPAAPTAAEPLSVQTTTAHYVFHAANGDAIEPDRQERFHEWAVARLGVTVDRSIAYYKYRDRTHMQSVTGKVTNGWADPSSLTVHSIWPWENHEVVHVLTAIVGIPPDFFNEGIAVAMSTDPSRNVFEARWNGQPPRSLARQYRAAGQLPALADMVETQAFRRIDETKGYPIAGSFMSFMIDDRGMEPVRAFFAAGGRDARVADIDRQFTSAFGISLQAAEARWHGSLDAP